MDPKDIHTYTNGFEFRMREPLTKSGMVNICRSLERKFGDGNVFEPDRIGDGFIKWAAWPGKKSDQAYKCMRACGSKVYTGSWPFVPDDAMTAWDGDYGVALGAGHYDTFLKAFYSAPAWTVDELSCIKECLEGEGFKVTRMPSLDEKKRKTGRM